MSIGKYNKIYLNAIKEWFIYDPAGMFFRKNSLFTQPDLFRPLGFHYLKKERHIKYESPQLY